MPWEPRVPLVAAEHVVNYPLIDGHILERRVALERAIRAPVRDLADAMWMNMGLPSTRAFETLRGRLFRGLAQTYLFGFREARRELSAHRRSQKTPEEEWEAPPVNVAPFLHSFVHTNVENFVDALSHFYVKTDLGDPLLQIQMHDKAQRLAHNMVLEQIGYVLNAGRTLAALGKDEPTILAARTPARWAMRSEQLDENTCMPCEQLHGEVVQVGTPEYFALLPPSACLGRGRCRGIFVYADSPDDFRVRSVVL